MSKENVLRAAVGPLFKRLASVKERTVLSVGGARSGKSYSTAQLLLMRAQNHPGLNVGVTRKTMPALRMTAQRLVLDLLKKYGLYRAARHNKMEHYYMLGRSRIQFFSLDDPKKIKSSEFNYIWMEEATEFTYLDYITLLTRLSAPAPAGLNNQIFLTLNPTDADGWINLNLPKQKQTAVIHSTYKDNPFLDQSYIDTLLGLKDIDQNSYKVFALGKGVKKTGVIYEEYSFYDEAPEGEVVWGLDFGYNNPTALVRVTLYDGNIYAEERLYQAGLTTNALIERLKEIVPPGARAQCIYADGAEPDRIEEIYRAGFNIKPASKAVYAGVMALKNKKIFINRRSVNLIKEIQNYCWKTDKNGNVLDEPVKFNDHALDALRYGVHTHLKEFAPAPEVSFF